jgi:hypothetical protein
MAWAYRTDTMNEQPRQTELAGDVIDFGSPDECRRLEGRIVQLQRDERCVQRAASFAGLFTALVGVCLGYEAVFEQDFLVGQYPFAIKLVCELGVAALISLVAFMGLWTAYRMKLNRLRKECGSLVAKLPEPQLQDESIKMSSLRR